ncbi:hypothetical protein GOODEAATRI_002726 [Goodea atripinnis]|uniref:protein-tyrosine-phosphatase n=1 Tax=Goodea atripinnis TaxID=208336 RepID=A0ABV0MEI0_9TELE
MSGTKFNIRLHFVFPAGTMVPLLFSVATTTISNINSTTNDTSSKGGDASPSHQILSIVLVVSLLILIFTLLAWYILRLKNQKKAVVTTVDKKIPNGILEEQELGYSSESLYTVVPPEQQTVVLLPKSPSASKTYLPIPVDHLEEEYRLRSADDGKLFREEYNSLPGGNAQGTYEEANKDENKEKNRYPNILPYDHSRAVLTQLDGNPCSDYINASYVDDKCYQYWPDQGCWTYGNARVAVEDCTVLVDYTIRKFCVQHQASDAAKTPRLVTQLHFTSWPDFGVPFSPIGMLKFLKKVKTVNPPCSGPIVVHCRGIKISLLPVHFLLKEKQTRTIRHFHFHGWPEIGIPAEGKGMIDIIASVQRQQQQSGNHPIVVHCRQVSVCKSGFFLK